MRPVLVLFDSQLRGYDATVGISERSELTHILKTLTTLGIPFECRWTAEFTADGGALSLPDATKVAAAEARYSMCCVATMDSMSGNNSKTPAWVDGSKAFPAFVAQGIASHAATGHYSGASAGGNLAAHEDFTSQWGTIGIWTGTTVWALEADAVPLVYGAVGGTSEGKSWMWKRVGTGGTVYWCSGRNVILGLLIALAQVAEISNSVSYPLIFEIDHTDWVYKSTASAAQEATALANLQSLVDTLRLRGAVCISGVHPENWLLISQAARDLIINSQDVLLTQPHSHQVAEETPWSEKASGSLWADSETFPTVAEIVAEFRAQAAYLTGLTVVESQYLNLPWNAFSMLALQAMAALGKKAFRVGVAGEALNEFAGATPLSTPTRYRLKVQDITGALAETLIGIPTTTLGVSAETQVEGPTYADEYAYVSQSTLAGYHAQRLTYSFRDIIINDAPSLYFHGDTLRGVASGRLFFDTFDVFVQACSPIVRWATKSDIHNVETVFRRRMHR